MSILSKSTMLLAIIVVISTKSLAQHHIPGLFQNRYSTKIEKFEFNHLELPEGVSHFTVNAILRDRQGFMWFATTDGAYRYDGYHYKIFKHNPLDSTSIIGDDVNTIFQDSLGQLWFGTTKGLCSLDSKTGKFKQYVPNPNSPSNLLGEEVYDIYEDKSGNLWIGTWGGLNLFNRQEGTFKHFQQSNDSANGLPDYRVMDINQDQWGTLWIATLDGLCAMVQDSNGNTYYKNYHDIPDDQTSLYGNSVYWTHVDNKGGLWVGTHSGFCRINRPPPTEKENGLNRVTFSRVLPLDYGKNDEIMWEIGEDQFGNFWLSSWGKGLLFYNPQTGVLKRLQHNPVKSNSLSDNTVNTLYIDAKPIGGAIWIGSLHGIDVFFPKKRKFALYQHNADDPSSLSNNHIHSIFEDSQGDLWIGTMKGINRLKKDTKTFQHYFSDPSNPNTLSSNLVLSIYEDRQKNLWFGTYEGLNFFNRKNEGFLKDKNLIRIDDRILRVFAFCEDNDGNFWLGTRHGLIYYNRERQIVKKYDMGPNKLNGLPGSEVRSLLIDQRGVFWIGTTGGLAIFDMQNGKFHGFSYLPDNPQGLSNPTIWKIYEDSQGELWFGTNGGLNKLVKANSTEPSDWHFEHYTEKDGLAANHVSGILEDDSGYLWLSTTRGLSRFDPKTGKFKNYDTEDGLQSNDFTNAGYFKTSDGKLLFGGINGLNVFDPDSIVENEHIPPVVLTEFRIFDKPVNLNSDINSIDEIKLSYRENFFSFEFAALDFTQPKKNRYAYRMQGFDSDWIYSGSRRYASYTNLDPGEYVFRVRGSNNDGVWNEEGTAIRITITPPFWQTWWAYALYASIFLIGLITLRRYELHKRRQREEARLRKERERANLREARLRAEAAESRTKVLHSEKEAEKQQMRMRIATDLHDEIGSNLSSITLLSHLMQNRPELAAEIREAFQDVNQAAKISTEAIRDIVWFINPKSDKLGDLVMRMNATANSMLHEIEYGFEHSGVEAAQKLQPGVKRNIYLIYKEILTNIIKHARATRVDISLAEKDGYFRMTIEDNGIGFDQSIVKQGNGMKNMLYRASQIGGQLETSSVPGKGSWIELSLTIT